MLVVNEGQGPEELDARGAKKPLNWTCLSCDKDIPNYRAKLGEYRPWSQLPSKYVSPEKTDKMGATFGKGHLKL